jgi:ribonuclease P/MRP protein subunit POP5
MVKFKSRYLLIEPKFENEAKSIKDYDAAKLANIIKKHVENLFGDLGLGKVNKNLQISFLRNFSNLVIIRVSRDHIKLLWTVLSLINQLEGETVKMHILKISGTIKKCELKAKQMLEKWMINYEKTIKNNI